MDLTDQIARMKGMKLPGDLEGLEVVALIGGEYSWTRDDAKALDLADELTDAGFEVGIASWNPGDGRRHRVRVSGHAGTPDAFEFTVEGSSRPEAICKAWLAAREWMATKGGRVTAYWNQATGRWESREELGERPATAETVLASEDPIGDYLATIPTASAEDFPTWPEFRAQLDRAFGPLPPDP